MLRTLQSPVDAERRAGLAIFVAMRWVLAAASLFVVNFHGGSTPPAIVANNCLVAGAAALNLLLAWRLRSRRPVPLRLPLVLSLFDVVAVTLSLAFTDGFTSDAFTIYYPALLAFSLVFPGWWSMTYFGATAIGYLLVILSVNGNYHPDNVTDFKMLVLRLTTMAVTVLIANLVVRIERGRRERAVAAEVQRTAEVLVLEQRARAAERAMQAERSRLSQEVHDGVSQGVYMLTLNLETLVEVAARNGDSPLLQERLATLLRLSKSTLLETRNLLFDLEGVMVGQTSLTALLRNQAQEFSAVTGIPIAVDVAGEERPLPPATVGEVYRVVQEGLANIYKHAHALNGSLRLCYAADSISVQVVDSGTGFDAAQIAARGHGLRNMHGRAERLGGALAVETRPGAGVTLTVTIPACADSERSAGDATDSPAAG